MGKNRKDKKKIKNNLLNFMFIFFIILYKKLGELGHGAHQDQDRRSGLKSAYRGTHRSTINKVLTSILFDPTNTQLWVKPIYQLDQPLLVDVYFFHVNEIGNDNQNNKGEDYYYDNKT